MIKSLVFKGVVKFYSKIILGKLQDNSLIICRSIERKFKYIYIYIYIYTYIYIYIYIKHVSLKMRSNLLLVTFSCNFSRFLNSRISSLEPNFRILNDNHLEANLKTFIDISAMNSSHPQKVIRNN
jgi:hypothetical protein